MDGWTVTVDAKARDEREGSIDIALLDDGLAQLAQILAAYSVITARAQDGTSYSVTLSLEDAQQRKFATPEVPPSPWSAASSATLEALLMFEEVRSICALPRFAIVNVHARTFAEHDAELEQPAYPELVGVAELAGILGVSRQRVSELRGRTGFPEPIADLRSGPVWTRGSVDRFISEWPRKRGRPRTMQDILEENEVLREKLISALPPVIPPNVVGIEGTVGPLRSARTAANIVGIDGTLSAAANVATAMSHLASWMQHFAVEHPEVDLDKIIHAIDAGALAGLMEP